MATMESAFAFLLVCSTLILVTANTGKEFVVGFLTNERWSGTNILYITSQTDTVVRVEVPYISMNRTYHVTSGIVTAVYLSAHVRMSTLNGKKKKGIRVTSDHHIALYGLNARSYSSDGFLGLPLQMLQTEYIVPSYHVISSRYPAFLGIVAPADNTRVAVTLGKSSRVTYSGTLYGNGDTINATLGPLEVLQIGSTADLTGTIVRSNKKVAVFSGNDCSIVGHGYCDHLVEQIPPISRWGTDHITIPTPNRTVGDVFRILAASNRTSIHVDGNVKLLDQGDFAQYDIPSDDAREIKCDKPCLVVKYSKGRGADLPTDPSMMIIPPVSAYTSAAVLATPKIVDGRGFKTFISVALKTSDTSRLLIDDQRNMLAWEEINGTGFSRSYMIADKSSYKISHLSNSARFFPLVSGHRSGESFGFPGSWRNQNISELCQPSVTFPADTNQSCRNSLVPDVTGLPSVESESCDTSVSFTFTDTFASEGRCPDSLQVLHRNFIGVDSFERTYTNVQKITSFPVVDVHSNENSVDVKCGQESMRVVVKRKSYPDLNPEKMHLQDPSCNATQYNDTHIVMDVPFNECGSTKTSNKQTLIFGNKVTTGEVYKNGSGITRRQRVEFLVSCSLKRNATIGGSRFMPRGVIAVKEEGYGELTFVMELYRSGQYREAYRTFPVNATLNKRIYVQLELKSNTHDLVLFTERCIATPHPPSKVGHTLLDDGCAKDDTLQYNYEKTRQQRFSFQAFRFMGDYQAVYLQCDVLACHAASNDSRCTRGCLIDSRQRRETAQATNGYDAGSNSQKVSIGPIVRKIGDEKSNKGNAGSQESNFVPVVSGAVAGVLALAIICVTVLAALRMLKQRSPKGSVQSTEPIDNEGFESNEMNTVA